MYPSWLQKPARCRWPQSSTALLGWTLAPLNHICNTFSFLFFPSSRKHQRPLPSTSWKPGWVESCPVVTLSFILQQIRLHLNPLTSLGTCLWFNVKLSAALFPLQTLHFVFLFVPLDLLLIVGLSCGHPYLFSTPSPWSPYVLLTCLWFNIKLLFFFSSNWTFCISFCPIWSF